MGNVIALAQKELKSYFASPIAYIVIGLWALLYGYFFVAILSFFVRQSMQMNQFGMQGPQAMNVNQQLIKPLLQNVTILILFLMPMVTMRTYAEEKRSGTIELLLTSPLTDFQIIMGKFFGALALDAIMLAVTFLHIGLLFIYGQWDPWTGGKFPLGDATESDVLTQPEGTHGARIESLDPADRAEAFAMLEAWTGVTPTATQARRAGGQGDETEEIDPPPPRVPPALVRALGPQK